MQTGGDFPFLLFKKKTHLFVCLFRADQHKEDTRGCPALASTILFRDLPVDDAQPCFSDSFYVPHFVQRYLGLDPDECFARINDEAPWTDPTDKNFRYRGHELPRQKAFWVRAARTGHAAAAPMDVNSPPDPLRKYRYPGFQYGSMLHYRPLEATAIVRLMSDELQNHLVLDGKPVEVNHVIGTRYRDRDDYISFHADKVNDIADGSPILSLSFGEMRELHVARNDQLDKPVVFKLGPGDLFVLGYKTNLAYKHAIVPVAQELQASRDVNRPCDTDDAAATVPHVGPRISLVLRNISTLISLKEVRTKAAKTRADRRKRLLSSRTTSPDIKKRIKKEE